jgi:hypothetical protein
VITPAPDRVAPRLTHARLNPKRFHGPAPIAAPAGHTVKKLSGRWAGRKLKPGRYKLRISAVDTAGNAASPQTLPFTLVR